MKKRLVGLLMAGTMVLCLAGCSSGSEKQEETSDEPQGNTYTVWAWDANVEAIQEAADMYNEATGANIQLDVVTVVNEDSRNKLVTMGETGDYDSLPDFTLMEDTAISQFVNSYPDMLIDLTDYDIPWQDLVESKRSLYTIDDRYYALPMDSGASIAMYRTDYLEEAGYTIDDLSNVTWDRVIEIGADVYEKTGHYLLLDDATSCLFR
ncbi:MAG TPA: ABC transporter substrate-binding protein [Candidatus Mediterraneibacter norfolkensis]|nr:ABC transporter substrate-binding protein [Candidatus Mediterraneibacter norfolkensis]